MEWSPDNSIRPARFAGTWYHEDPRVLEKTFAATLEAARGALPSPPAITGTGDAARESRSLVLPHAGLAYSLRGIMTGIGFIESLWSRPPSRVVILSPSHYRALVPGSLHGGAFSGLETPFGILAHHCPPLPGPDGDAMSGVPPIPGGRDDGLLATEHALEMFLPVLAWRWPKCLVTLLACGTCRKPGDWQNLSRWVRFILSEPSEKDQGPVLLIASSDISHFGPRFDDYPMECRQLDSFHQESWILRRDRAALNLLLSDPALLFRRAGELAPTMCGLVPALVASRLCRDQKTDGTILHQYSSLTTGSLEDHSFVSYAAVDLGCPLGSGGSES